MRLVLYTFCGVPLRAGAIIIGLFTSIISCIALGDQIREVLRSDGFPEIYITRDDWLDYMAVKISIVFLVTVVSFLQFIGGIKQSQNLILPFCVCGCFLVGGMLCDQVISAALDIGSFREFRGVVSPAVLMLFFVWIDISYIHEMRAKFLQRVKPGVTLA